MSANLGWPWSVLDLSPKDADARSVKRAYAKKLKAIDPQEDPQGFQNLRTAYEQALRFAQTKVVVAVPEQSVQAPVSMPETVEKPVAVRPVMPKPALPPTPLGPDVYIGRPANTLGVLVSQIQNLFTKRDLSVQAWRPVFNKLVELDLAHAKQFEKELLAAFNSHLFPDGVRQSRVVPRVWVELVETRFGWFSHGLDFQRMHPEHFNLWTYLNDIYRPPLSERQKQKNLRQAYMSRDPKVPIYLRWWFLLLGYFGLMYLVV